MAKKMTREDVLKSNLFVVFYEIIGDRCNGSYLVKAKTPAQAKKAVLAIYDDYVVRYKGNIVPLDTIIRENCGIDGGPRKILTAEDRAEYDDELGMFLEGVKVPRKMGGTYQIVMYFTPWP